MGKRYGRASVAVGLSAVLVAAGIPTQAVAESLGIEDESRMEVSVPVDSAAESVQASRETPVTGDAQVSQKTPAAEGSAVSQGASTAGITTDTKNSGLEKVQTTRLPGAPTSSDESPVQKAPDATQSSPDSSVTADKAPATKAVGDFTVLDNTYVERWVDDGGVVDVALPKRLRVQREGGAIEAVSVTWRCSYGYVNGGNLAPESVVITDGVAKSLAAGSYTFVTDIDSAEVSYTVRVNMRSEEDVEDSIQSIDPIVQTLYTTDYTTEHDEFQLGGVEAVMSSGERQWLEVRWEEIPRSKYDGDEDQGEFTVKGLIERYGNYELTATVIVAVPREQRWVSDVFTPAGKTPELPKEVDIAFSDGSSRNVPVAWDMPDDELFSQAGVVYVEGALPNSDLRAQVKVKVAGIASLEYTREVHTLVGCLSTDDLTQYAWVQFEDGTSGNVPIDWEAVDESEYATSGTLEVKGTLRGYGEQVTCTVHVHADVLSRVIEQRVPAGEGPNYHPSYTSSELFGLTEDQSRYFQVDWNDDEISALDFTTPGTYTVRGTIIGADIPVEKRFIVVDIDHIEQLESVKTLVGAMPKLPESVDVAYTDGTVENHWISWNPIIPSQYAKEGTFEATGTVYFDSGREEQVSCTVEVLLAQAPKEIKAATLVGRRPELPREIRVNMWDGTPFTAVVQWENPSASDFNKPGEFDVRGYLLGSQLEVTAHVAAMGLKNDVVAEQGYYPGMPEMISINSNLELENGDEIWVQSVVWDSFPQDLLAGKAGTYEVGGTIAETPVHVRALVTTGPLVNVWASDAIALPAGKELVMPATVNGEIEGGIYVSEIPITWDAYEKNPTSNIVVTGHIKGYDKPVEVTVHVITDPTFDLNKRYFKKGFDGTEYLPDGAQVKIELENGWTTSPDWCPITWDTSNVDWNVSGSIPGMAHATEIGYSKDVAVTLEYGVLDESAIDDDLEYWTEPGAAPVMSEVSVRVEPSYWWSTYPKWEDIDPALYEKVGSTFKVKGRIEEMGFDIEATVHVEDIRNIELPESISTTSGSMPSLPYEIPVTWTDGSATMERVQWDDIPGSVYKGEAGKTTTIYGTLFGNGNEDTGRRVSTKIVIVGPSQVYDNGELAVATQAGSMPPLPSSVAARMTNDVMAPVSIVWDPIPSERYAKPGTFEATGRIEGYAPRAISAKLREKSGNINVAPDGTVTATVTVLPKDERPVLNQPIPLYFNVVAGSSLDDVVPPYVFAHSSAPGADAAGPSTHAVTWDLDGLDLNTPGSYRVTGTLDDDKTLTAVMYINALPKPRVMQKVALLELTVKVGATPQELDRALLREVEVVYSDGTSGIVEVDSWNLSPVTQDALNKPGDISITGALVGSTLEAQAVIHVVESPAAMPADVLPVDPIKVSEGTKLDDVVKMLPSHVTVRMGDDSTQDVKVTWDAPRALGSAGSEQTVSGITENGLKAEVKIVVGKRQDAQSIVVSGDGVEDGAVKLKQGDTLKLSFSIEPEGANSSAVWASSDSDVASVDDNGMVTAKSEGEAVVTVTAVSGVKASVAVTVEKGSDPTPDPDPEPNPDPEPTPDPDPDPNPTPNPDPDPNPDSGQGQNPGTNPMDPNTPGSGDGNQGQGGNVSAGGEPDDTKSDAAVKPAGEKLVETGDPASAAVALGGTGLISIIAAFADRWRKRR